MGLETREIYQSPTHSNIKSIYYQKHYPDLIRGKSKTKKETLSEIKCVRLFSRTRIVLPNANQSIQVSFSSRNTVAREAEVIWPIESYT